MQLIIDAAGSIRCLYDEAIDLAALGSLSISRASHVEPNEQSQWFADLAPVGGPVLGPFARRSEALEAEREWLDKHPGQWGNEPARPQNQPRSAE